MPTQQAQEYEYWNQKFTDLRRGQLETVQSAANNWAKAYAALIGVFATVTFAGGVTTIDKLPKKGPFKIGGQAFPGTDTLTGEVQALVVTAFVFALIGTILTSLAAGGLFPRTRKKDSPTALAVRSTKGAKTALILLRIGQLAGTIAVLLVLGGSLLVFLNPSVDAAPSPPTVIAPTSEGVRCGPLMTGSQGLEIDGEKVLTAGTITVVAACPPS